MPLMNRFWPIDSTIVKSLCSCGCCKCPSASPKWRVEFHDGWLQQNCHEELRQACVNTGSWSSDSLQNHDTRLLLRAFTLLIVMDLCHFKKDDDVPFIVLTFRSFAARDAQGHVYKSRHCYGVQGDNRREKKKREKCRWVLFYFSALILTPF